MAAAKAKPGSLTWARGNGTMDHVGGDLFQRAQSVLFLTHTVPYKCEHAV